MFTRPVHEIDGPAPLESRLSSSGESDTWTTSKCFLIRFHCRCPLSESSYRFLSSPVSLPFSAAHFLGPLLRANSCVLQLRGLCFPGSALNSIGISQRLLLTDLKNVLPLFLAWNPRKPVMPLD